MKGCLREDFCIHAEKVKSLAALHGSAHSQECLACLPLPVGRPGKTNNFASSFARINKPWSSLEAGGNWAAFCFNYGRAPVRARIPVMKWENSPGSGSCTGLCPSWQWLGCAAQGAQNLHCLLLKYLLFPELFADVPKLFFEGHFNTELAQTDLGMGRWLCSPLSFQGFLLLSSFSPFLSSVRCICFFLSCVTVKRMIKYRTPIFLGISPLLQKCGVTFWISQARPQGLFSEVVAMPCLISTMSPFSTG